MVTVERRQGNRIAPKAETSSCFLNQQKFIRELTSTKTRSISLTKIGHMWRLYSGPGNKEEKESYIVFQETERREHSLKRDQ